MPARQSRASRQRTAPQLRIRLQLPELRIRLQLRNSSINFRSFSAPALRTNFCGPRPSLFETGISTSVDVECW